MVPCLIHEMAAVRRHRDIAIGAADGEHLSLRQRHREAHRIRRRRRRGSGRHPGRQRSDRCADEERHARGGDDPSSRHGPVGAAAASSGDAADQTPRVSTRASPMSRSRRLRSFVETAAEQAPNRAGVVGRQRRPVRLLPQDGRQRCPRRLRPRRRAGPSASRTARQPNAQMSRACRRRFPRACSGLM